MMNRPQIRKIVFILGTLSAFGPLSIDMYLSAFPSIARDFNVPVSDVQYSLTSFFIGLSLGQLFYGPVIDRYGRKKPVLFGMFLYGIASILCAIAPGIGWLITGRCLQALGACAGFVASRAIVRDIFTPAEMAKVFSMLMLIMGLAPILAPIIGGQILILTGWKMIFYLLGLIGLSMLLVVYFQLPETKAPDKEVKLSNALSSYMSLLKNSGFMKYSLAGGAAQAGMFAYITGSPFVFIELFQVKSENYGWIFGSNAFGLIASSQLNTYLLRKFKSEQILKFALSFFVFNGLLILLVASLNLGMWFFLVPLFLFISTLGITLPNTSALALTYAEKYAGSASALLGTIQFSFAVISSALISKLSNGTSAPLGIVMCLCGIVSTTIFFAGQRKRTAH